MDYAYGCDGDEDIEVRGTLDLTRDNAGNPLTWGNDDYKKTYTYDDNNRLATAALPGNSTATYNYDWVGNRQGSGITYNAADQMTASPGVEEYTYDGNGNMLTGTMAFSYSPINLVTEAGSTDMAWDSMGNRVSFTTSASATYQFVYDRSAGIPAVVEEVTPGGSVYYVREPNGTLIARITGTGESQVTTYYHFDELGSTLFLTDPDGILTDKYTYDAWGNVTSHVGSTSQPYQFVGQLGYYTHYQESGFDLLQLGVRFYDPEMERFMQRDPAGGQDYSYAGNCPARFKDPSGKDYIEGPFTSAVYWGKGCTEWTKWRDIADSACGTSKKYGEIWRRFCWFIMTETTYVLVYKTHWKRTGSPILPDEKKVLKVENVPASRMYSEYWVGWGESGIKPPKNDSPIPADFIPIEPPGLPGLGYPWPGLPWTY